MYCLGSWNRMMIFVEFDDLNIFIRILEISKDS